MAAEVVSVALAGTGAAKALEADEEVGADDVADACEGALLADAVRERGAAGVQAVVVADTEAAADGCVRASAGGAAVAVDAAAGTLTLMPLRCADAMNDGIAASGPTYAA